MTARPTLPITLRGVVEAPVEAVAEVLLDIGPSGRSPIMPPGRVSQIEAADRGVYTVTVKQAGARVSVRVDPNARNVTIEGQWWYRADITLTPHEAGCLITQHIVNVARHLRWAVRHVARESLAESPGAFAAILQALHQRLGCPTYPSR